MSEPKVNTKYFRISNTTETVSDVSNYYAEPITIGANSKVALDSMSILIDQSSVVFDCFANSFQIKNTDDGTLENVNIEDGSYTSGQFLKELNRAMNATTILEPNGIRTEWLPIFNTDGKLSIQYLTCIDDEGTDVDITPGPNMNIQVVGIRTVLTSNDNSGGYAYMPAKWINGAGVCKFQLATTASYSNKFICGLINNIPTGNIETLGPEDYYFCVYANKESVETNFLGLYLDGKPINPITPILIEDLTEDPTVCEFSIVDGKLMVTVDDVLFGEINYSFDQNLHGCFSQIASETPTKLIWYSDTITDDVVYTASPYQNLTSAGVSLITKNEDKIDFQSYVKYDDVGAPAIVPTLHSLTFTNSVRLLLGFSSNYYEADAIGHAFVAETVFNTYSYDSDLLVELPSFMLQSYDGTTTRRRNIIRMIPASETTLQNGRRRYTAPFPMYISLTSKESQILNSMQFRILDSTSGKPFPILSSNTCYITLIIQSDV